MEQNMYDEFGNYLGQDLNKDKEKDSKSASEDNGNELLEDLNELQRKASR